MRVKHLLIFFCIVTCLSACAQQRHKIKPRRMVLKDVNGQERAVLFVGEKQAQMSVRDESGKELFHFNLNESGMTLETVDETGERQGATISIESIEE